MTDRHNWSDPFRDTYRTDRVCWKCKLIKRTRHEPGQQCWTEWWRGATQIHSDKMPKCEPINAVQPA